MTETPTITMHRFLVGFAQGVLFAAALVAALVNYASAECFTSSHRVFKAHPGPGTYATWNNIDGRKCWYARGQKPGWAETDSPVGAQLRQGSEPKRKKEAGGPTRPSSASTVPLPRERPAAMTALTPKLVRTVAPPALAWPDTLTPETTGAATVRVMASAWNDGFDALKDRPTLIPAVVVRSHPRPIAATVVPHNSRSMSGEELLNTALWIVFIFGSGIGVPFLLGDAWNWFWARKAKVVEARG